MTGTVQLPGFAELRQLFCRPLDTGFFFTDQKQPLHARQAGQRVQQVLGQLAGLGQEQNGIGHGRLRELVTIMCRTGTLQHPVFVGQPAPGRCLWPFGQQMIGGSTCQQEFFRGKVVCLPQQHLASWVHGNLL